MNRYKNLFTISRNGINILLVCAVIGMSFGAGLFCISKFSSKAADPTVTAAILAMIALASHLVGWLLGFLFGVPRVIQERAEESVRDRESDSKNLRGNHGEIEYRVNTNLENVSDWLTKILVGVGLTQFGNIKNYLVDISLYFSAGMSDVENIEQMVTVTIVYFLINGFFSGYFLTRLFFTGAFSQAEERKSRKQFETEESAKDIIGVENLNQEERGEVSALSGQEEREKEG